MISKQCLVFATIGIVAALLGCGSPHDLAPVAGQVTIDGQPYPGCKVIFSPVAKADEQVSGRSAYARADSEGRFVLTTYNEGDGALVGMHRITLFRVKDHKTVRPDLSGLSFKRVSAKPVQIEPGDNKVDLAFTSDEIRQRGNQL